MVIILGDLIADLSMRIPEFPIHAQDLKPISYLEIGPGGATNIAIMAARLGLPVACIGEIGNDHFGKIVMDGLKREGIETRDVITHAETKTPVAGVIVDQAREPAYLGYKGNLTAKKIAEAWCSRIQHAEALFADGWIEIAEMPRILLEAFQIARIARVATFFDPGPGNPAFSLDWHVQVAALSTVLLLNEEEAKRLAHTEDANAAAQFLIRNGSSLVVLKRGGQGMTLFTASERVTVPAFRVEARDFTGAGDSVTGAIMYGYLNDLSLQTLGILGNATGAAKVQKFGTGHNMPTRDEIRVVLTVFAPQHVNLI